MGPPLEVDNTHAIVRESEAIPPVVGGPSTGMRPGVVPMDMNDVGVLRHVDGGLPARRRVHSSSHDPRRFGVGYLQ